MSHDCTKDAHALAVIGASGNDSNRVCFKKLPNFVLVFVRRDFPASIG
jgi:hypothetical protein